LLDVLKNLGNERKGLNHWLMIFFPNLGRRPLSSYPMHFPHTIKKTIKWWHDAYPPCLREGL